jgi:hypothetical protein
MRSDNRRMYSQETRETDRKDQNPQELLVREYTIEMQRVVLSNFGRSEIPGRAQVKKRLPLWIKLEYFWGQRLLYVAQLVSPGR